ncbi:MAG: hypothetical protein Q7U93_06715 [Nitrosomonas sp.]|nr:hypothetical protein [Nitrosomonas sp.]
MATKPNQPQMPQPRQTPPAPWGREQSNVNPPPSGTRPMAPITPPPPK